LTRVLVLAHAPLASSMRDLARHAFPECAAELEVIDVPADADPGSLQSELLRQLGQTPVLVLVDVLGATPANALLAVLPQCPQARAVAGLNLPMLWRVLCYRQHAVDDLKERALQGGVRGVIPIEDTSRT
jgi:PTS system mannose-specific IIA component